MLRTELPSPGVETEVVRNGIEEIDEVVETRPPRGELFSG
jgi:hypothetical protein